MQNILLLLNFKCLILLKSLFFFQQKIGNISANGKTWHDLVALILLLPFSKSRCVNVLYIQFFRTFIRCMTKITCLLKDSKLPACLSDHIILDHLRLKMHMVLIRSGKINTPYTPLSFAMEAFSFIDRKETNTENHSNMKLYQITGWDFLPSYRHNKQVVLLKHILNFQKTDFKYTLQAHFHPSRVTF